MAGRCLVGGMLLAVCLAWGSDGRNLLLNACFDFHAYGNHRHGRAVSYEADYVPHWNASGAKVVKVMRDSHVPAGVRPAVPAPNGVKLLPGAVFSQFFTLPEGDLIPGERLSFQCHVYQEKADAVVASLQLMKIDSEDGTWCPKKDFGLHDNRVFKRHGRGELVAVFRREARGGKSGAGLLKIEDYEIIAHSTPGDDSHSKDVNTVGVKVMFENRSGSPAWIFRPSLVRGKRATEAVGDYRCAPDFYRHIPRTMQKLWKGEPLHIVVMGSSIDRGSANPPMYPYNEDPTSPDFKKPLCDQGQFSTKMVGRPDLDMHFAHPRHFYSYCGRLKVELMKKFNYPADRILLNFMACDGSCIGESHSGLRTWCELKEAPNPELNGHKSGKSWQELYPSLFSRVGGPRPDLIIYGSGANERTDTPNEGAVFEGAIRFLQKAYPGVEFIFCVFQNYGGYTSAPGDLQALALRYGIPFVDYGLIGDRICRDANRKAVVDWGHPQAGIHYLWFKQLERAFECADPVGAGFPQTQLPERAYVNTYNWEGEMRRYKAPHARLWQSRLVVLDDSAFNCWGTSGRKKGSKKASGLLVDGRKIDSGHFPWLYERNSMARHGALGFGDRHVVELAGDAPRFTAVDCKVSPERRWIGVESGHWQLPGGKAARPYASQVGFPYGRQVVALKAGERATISVVGTSFSVAWVDADKAGEMNVTADGKRQFVGTTGKAFKLTTGEALFLENRKGFRLGAYGVHEVTVEAVKGPVTLMGIFCYDERPNHERERIIRGVAQRGETVSFEPPFKARPVILGAPVKAASNAKATFSASGWFEAVGE